MLMIGAMKEWSHVFVCTIPKLKLYKALKGCFSPTSPLLVMSFHEEHHVPSAASMSPLHIPSQAPRVCRGTVRSPGAPAVNHTT